jgi:hypothetical protein
MAVHSTCDFSFEPMPSPLVTFVFVFGSTNPDEASFKKKWNRAIELSADNPLDRGIERVAFSWKCVQQMFCASHADVLKYVFHFISLAAMQIS